MVDLTLTRDNCLVKVREGCAAVAHRATHVAISEERLAEFAQAINAEEVRAAYGSDIQPFPLRFDSLDQEINFHTILQLLNFGSAYHELVSDRTVFETVQYGMLGLVLSGRKLTAQTLTSLSLTDIGQTFGLEVKRDAVVKPNTPIYTEEDTEVAAFAKLLQRACDDTGRRLRELDCDDFAQFFRKFLDDKQPKASAFVFVLWRHLPAFCDGYSVGDSQVLLMRRAQLLAMELHRRFAFRVPLFDFVDLDQLTTPVGATVPAVLRAAGVLQYGPQLAERVGAGRSVTGDLEAELRGTASKACQEIARQANVTPAALYFYLQQLASKEPFASSRRHLTPSTISY
eukprot:EG_transcript_14961